MTGPVIPAGEWPEDAALHTWDSNGLGNWLRPSYGAWHLWGSDIPPPPGHDWLVPVMRQQSPAIDLEQALRELLQRWGELDYPMSYEGRISQDTLDACVADVLALIDGSKNNNLPHVGDINVVVSQPSKGEGE